MPVCAREVVWEAGHRPAAEPERRNDRRPPPYALGSSRNRSPYTQEYVCQFAFRCGHFTRASPHGDARNGPDVPARPGQIASTEGECQAIAPYQPHISPSRRVRPLGPHAAGRYPSATSRPRTPVGNRAATGNHLCASESATAPTVTGDPVVRHLSAIMPARFTHEVEGAQRLSGAGQRLQQSAAASLIPVVAIPARGHRYPSRSSPHGAASDPRSLPPQAPAKPAPSPSQAPPIVRPAQATVRHPLPKITNAPPTGPAGNAS
ncbi:hypothetical protein SCNRRL3882_3334 [Streptomyces chartreusis NRRL 3882]|uniref:Uncharacterized protein n=1 Tax=Streptomyces chartreusis NRRL 3882 TaxID=1079985 RepID=A0A2N9B943_STRCX|nr:hypothetical protein SCNRRL3882_3334 [Streptomyces chartreusis NRRL 3882]